MPELNEELAAAHKTYLAVLQELTEAQAATDKAQQEALACRTYQTTIANRYQAARERYENLRLRAEVAAGVRPAPPRLQEPVREG